MAPRIAWNRVSTLARKIWPTVRPGADGAVLTWPACIRACTSAWSRPTAAEGCSSVMAVSHGETSLEYACHHYQQPGHRAFSRL